MQYRRTSRFGSLIFAVVLFSGVGLIFLQRNAIYDWLRLRGYQAPAQIVQLATDTTMSPQTRRLFYVYHPALESKESFNQHCGDNEQTIVLGCYVQRRGIYLYNVSDARLQGVTQVTAAHETLHAAYDRLSSSERKAVDAMTARAYAQVTDERMRSTIDSYRQRDPSVVPNELHSILGTEVRNLPADLETYYKRYFTNRAAIVGYSEQYESEFTSRKQQVETYDERLKDMKAQIDGLSTTLEQQASTINAEAQRLQTLRRSDQIPEYNAAVPGYNQQVNAYNANVRKQRTLISDYNNIVKERNALAVEENQLIKAIDSRTNTIDTQ